jgi:hypothetical protein
MLHFTKSSLLTAMTLLVVLTGAGLWLAMESRERDMPAANEAVSAVQPVIEAGETSGITAPSETSINELVEKYGNLGLTDVHNHDASGPYESKLGDWEWLKVKRVVLFGDASEPSAIQTDAVAWEAYQAHPELIIPFFSGFDLHSPSSLDTVRTNLEKGYMGLGEIVAASISSPVVSKVLWKGDHPMDGYLPQIYALCAEYKAPILLHIDPPNGWAVGKLEEAMRQYPDTAFLFAHINAFNSPESIEALMEKHSNLYADFSAGFTAYSPESSNKLEDFLPLIRRFPDRVLLSTDSGYGLQYGATPATYGETTAIDAMYRLLDLVDDPVLQRKLAHDNFDALVRQVPATKTQLEALKSKGIAPAAGKALTKLEAGKLLADNK